MLSIQKIVRGMSKLGDRYKQFIEIDGGASVRQAPSQKQRKYIHVQIAQNFKKQEEERKKLRLEHMKQRRKILEHKINTQSKLLTHIQSQQLSDINTQISSLEALLQIQTKQLELVEKNLEDTQATYVLMEGYKKLVVLNRIEYLRHMNGLPSGLVLYPQTLTMIENVHYLVNNNLPVNRIKLYEIMPDLFEKQVGQLDENIKRLIQEKNIDSLSDPSSEIRFFTRKQLHMQDPEQDIINLNEQRDKIFRNMEHDILQKISKHQRYLKQVREGRTPFRNEQHMITMFISQDLKLNLNEEEMALRNSLQEIMELKRKFQIYLAEFDQRMHKTRFRYIEPPSFIKNHPILFKQYEKVMQKYMKPGDMIQTLSIEDSNQDDGQAYLDQKLNQIASQKYDPYFIEMWNSGKKDELILNKKKVEIDFYNDSSKILEEYQELIANNKQQEEFIKLPKRVKLLSEAPNIKLKLDDITKAIFLNNKDPKKYTVQFFTKFFGFDNVEETKKVFNSVSYLQVFQQAPSSIENLKYTIIKMKE